LGDATIQSQKYTAAGVNRWLTVGSVNVGTCNLTVDPQNGTGLVVGGSLWAVAFAGEWELG
jgi:hypothetical protein